MNRLTRNTQKAAYSLNQSMTNGLPALTPDNMNLCFSQFYRRRTTQKYQDSPSNEISSGRQQFLFQKDIEQLKEEIMYLKKENMKLKNLNQQLCFQIKLDEKEQIDKKTTQEYSDDLTSNVQNLRLLEKLKQARLIIQEKQSEIDSLKKSTRFMKIQEMESELCNTKLKFDILNKQFNEVLKTEGEVRKFQNLTIQAVELEEKARQLSIQNEKQKKKVLALRQELLTCQAQKKKYYKQLENCQDEFEKYKKNHEQEIQKKTKFKDIIDSLNHQLNEKQLIIQQMQNEIDKQRMLVSQKQRQFKDLEEQYQTKKSWLTNKREADTSFQEVLDDKVNKNQIVVTDDDLTDSQLQKSETKIVLEDDFPRERSFVQQNRMSMDSARDDSKLLIVQSTKLVDAEVTKQKLPKVTLADVSGIAKQLKFQLISQHIPIEQIDQMFHPKQEITVFEVMEILTQFPFNIQQNKQALLLARYLVEDNAQPIVDFSLYSTNDSFIVKSVLKNVIGKYQLYDRNQQEQLMQQISPQIWKFRQSIIEQIKILISKRNISCEQCDEDDFKQAVQNSNILLDQKQRDFLGYFIYKEFEGEKLFDYKTLIDKFNNQLLMPSPPKISIQQVQ